MINTCKILRVIAIRTYWAEQLIFLSKMRISAQYVRIVRIGHSYVLGSNIRLRIVHDVGRVLPREGVLKNCNYYYIFNYFFNIDTLFTNPFKFYAIMASE